jgi:hypothetical protein
MLEPLVTQAESIASLCPLIEYPAQKTQRSAFPDRYMHFNYGRYYGSLIIFSYQGMTRLPIAPRKSDRTLKTMIPMATRTMMKVRQMAILLTW